MAKPASIKIRLNSTADTGFFYVTKKNAATTEIYSLTHHAALPIFTKQVNA
eukprot:gene35999-46072_t